MLRKILPVKIPSNLFSLLATWFKQSRTLKTAESSTNTYASSGAFRLHLAAILMVMFFMVAFGGYIYLHMRNAEMKTAQARLRDVGELKKVLISQWLGEQTRDVGIVSASPVIVDILGNVSGKVSLHELSRYLRIVKDKYQYKAIAVFDRNGNILMIEGDSDAAMHRSEALEAIAADKIRLVNFHLDYGARPELGYMAPVDVNGRTIGAIYAEVFPETALYPYIQLWPSDSTTAETLLIQKDRDGILYLNNLRHRKNSALNFRMPISKTNAAAVRAALGERGIQVSAVDYRDVPIISYASDIPETPWILISKLDEAEAYEGLNHIAIIGFFITSISLMLFTLLMRSWWLKSAHSTLEKINEELRQTAVQLQMSEAKFRRIIDSSPVAYALRDIQGNINYLNEAFVSTYGYELADIPTLEDWWLKAYPNKGYRQKVVSSWKHRMEMVRQTGTIFEPIELKITCKDGSIKFAKIGSAILGDVNQGIHVAIFFDVTEYKRMERDLVELNESKLQHLGMELHDNLGQQLTATAILADLTGNTLKRNNTADDAQIQQMHQISRQLQDMTALVRELSHGLHSVHLEQDDLLTLIADLASQTTEFSGVGCRLEHGAITTGITPEVSFNLYRIVQEAVNNAIKHSAATEIIISVKTEAGNLLISILDNGGGMTENATTSNGSGLRIMQHRASLVGAKLNIEQQQGVCVIIRMPL